MEAVLYLVLCDVVEVFEHEFRYPQRWPLVDALRSACAGRAVAAPWRAAPLLVGFAASVTKSVSAVG